ncbi:hypothetical protein QOT17_000836 [Balamuthia mandrillaris]
MRVQMIQLYSILARLLVVGAVLFFFNAFLLPHVRVAQQTRQQRSHTYMVTSSKTIPIEEAETYPLGPSRTNTTSVIVLWRESITLTAETLANVLQGCSSDTQVLYIHLDLNFWRPILERVEKLRDKYPNLRILTLSQWEDRQTTYRKGLERVPSRWVLFHDNNNLNTEVDLLQKLINGFLTTTPAPVLLAPQVDAIDSKHGAKGKDHHAVMKITLFNEEAVAARLLDNNNNNKEYAVFGEEAYDDNDEPALLHWAGWDGIPLQNSMGLKVVSGPAVETHSYMLDASRFSEDDLKIFNADCAFSSYHICLGLALYQRYGSHASAVLRNSSFHYIYPKAHLKPTDIPLTVTRWNAWDCLLSNSFLEHRYGVKYFHQCGWDWHNRVAFHTIEFWGKENQPISKDPMVTAALVYSMYVLHHVTHVRAEQLYREGYFEDMGDKKLGRRQEVNNGWMTAREAISWISDSPDLFSSSENAIMLAAQQRSVPNDYHAHSSFAVNADMDRRWIREELGVQQNQFPEHDYWLKETAKHDDINWCYVKLGFLWIQGKFPEQVHNEMKEKAIVMLQSNRNTGLHRYLFLVKKDTDTINRITSDESINSLLAKHQGYESWFKASFSWVDKRDELMRGTCFSIERRYWYTCSASLPLHVPGFDLVKWGKKTNNEGEYRLPGAGLSVTKIPGAD